MTSGACFDTGQHAACLATALPFRLADRHAEAFGRLLEVLLCGEESAALAFQGLGLTLADQDLARIAADELRHERLLNGLRAGLPDQPADVAFRLKTRRFFRSIECRDPTLHFVSIAALDSAICTVLSALLAPGRPLAGDPACSHTLGSIRLDETRHVRLSLMHARSSCPPGAGQARVLHVRMRLTRLLEERADAFELLEVDPDILLRHLSRAPRLLLA
jgi:hypothetical protein